MVQGFLKLIGAAQFVVEQNFNSTAIFTILELVEPPTTFVILSLSHVSGVLVPMVAVVCAREMRGVFVPRTVVVCVVAVLCGLLCGLVLVAACACCVWSGRFGAVSIKVP